MKIDTLAQNLLLDMISFRRFLHACPEQSGCEHKTSAFIFDTLTNFGYNPRYINTGVVADIKGKNSEKRIAFRADIDALPIIEKTNAPYASTNGFMHACGHDAHSALLLALAKALKQNTPEFDIRLIFQFGEEGEGGAAKMIEGGAIDKVDEIYALHLNPDLKKGVLATCKGAMFAGAAEIAIELFGKAAHCATPDKGIDAIKATAYFLSSADKINQDYQNRALFHTGKLSGGEARNIIASNVKIESSLRYFDLSDLEAILKSLKNILKECENKFGVKSKFDYILYRPLINCKKAVDKLKGIDKTIQDTKPLFTAEDFGEFTNKISGCMLWLGIKDENHFSPLHSDTFDFDEAALLKGLELFLKIAYQN